MSQVFDGMDRDSSGILDHEEIEQEALRARKKAESKLEEFNRIEAEQAASLAGQVHRKKINKLINNENFFPRRAHISYTSHK